MIPYFLFNRWKQAHPHPACFSLEGELNVCFRGLIGEFFIFAWTARSQERLIRVPKVLLD